MTQPSVQMNQTNADRRVARLEPAGGRQLSTGADVADLAPGTNSAVGGG